MSEVAGLTGEETDLLIVLRKIEEMYRQGFVGSMTVNCGANRQVSFEWHGTRTPRELLAEERRLQNERRTSGPRDGEDRRQKG